MLRALVFAILIPAVLSALGLQGPFVRAEQALPTSALTDQQCRDVKAWLPGTWIWMRGGHRPDPVQKIMFSPEGDTIRWTYERQGGLKSQFKEWGTKSAVTGEGTVEASEGCTITLSGQYVRSQKSFQIGKPLRFKFVRTNEDRLDGWVLGSGNRYLKMIYDKR